MGRMKKSIELESCAGQANEWVNSINLLIDERFHFARRESRPGNCLWFWVGYGRHSRTATSQKRRLAPGTTPTKSEESKSINCGMTLGQQLIGLALAFDCWDGLIIFSFLLFSFLGDYGAGHSPRLRQKEKTKEEKKAERTTKELSLWVKANSFNSLFFFRFIGVVRARSSQEREKKS